MLQLSLPKPQVCNAGSVHAHLSKLNHPCIPCLQLFEVQASLCLYHLKNRRCLSHGKEKQGPPASRTHCNFFPNNKACLHYVCAFLIQYLGKYIGLIPLSLPLITGSDTCQNGWMDQGRILWELPRWKFPTVIFSTTTINIAGEGVIKGITSINIGQKRKFPKGSKRKSPLGPFSACMLDFRGYTIIRQSENNIAIVISSNVTQVTSKYRIKVQSKSSRFSYPSIPDRSRSFSTYASRDVFLAIPPSESEV